MSNSLPNDLVLYDKIKKYIFNKNQVNSAYRSGDVVKEYKKQFMVKYGNKEPYSGNQNNSGLTRWFTEDWKNQRGMVGYQYKSDIYRPTKIINSKTPKTYNQLTETEIKKARKKKLTTGRVNKF